MKKILSLMILASMWIDTAFAQVRPIDRIKERLMQDPPQKGGNWFKANISLEAVLAILAILITLGGVWMARKKKRSVSSYFSHIDDTYANFKMKGRRCEAELYRLRDIVTEEFKKGKLDDGSFKLLDDRIDNYLKEVREQIVNEQFGGMPANLKTELYGMLESGDISEGEFKKFSDLIGKSTMGATEKDALAGLVKEWKKKDSR